MTTDTTYNGWTNYETWNVKLWMDNEQSSSKYYNELALECVESAPIRNGFTREESAAIQLADLLKSEYENAMADILDGARLQASVWADLLGASLSSVNWDEIARAFIDDLQNN